MAGKADEQPLHNSKDKNGPDSPPKRRPCTGYCCYKCLVVLYSLLFFVIGVCLFVIGVWVGKIKGNYESINDAVTTPVILAVVVGVLMIIFSFLGLIGALKEHIILLKIFFGIAICVFLVQVVIGILAFVFREETINVVNKQLSFAVEKYHQDDDVERAVNHIQQKFSCCGLSGPDDWDKNDIYACDSEEPYKECGIPDSCCKELRAGCGNGIRAEVNSTKLQRFAFKEGCTKKFRNWVERNLDLVGATALGLALLHVLGVFLVYFFITAVQDRVWLFKYRKRYYDN